jgi:hypothetical protein
VVYEMRLQNKYPGKNYKALGRPLPILRKSQILFKYDLEII